MAGKTIAFLGGGGDVARSFYRHGGFFDTAKKFGYDVVCIDPAPKLPPELEGKFSAHLAPDDKKLEELNFRAAVVATPPSLHLNGVRWAIGRKIPTVFVEKPLVAPKDLSEFRRLMAENKNVSIQGIDWVHGNTSFRDALPYIPKIGGIKEITTVLTESGAPEGNRAGMLATSKEGGGMNHDLSTHSLFFAFQALEAAGIKPNKSNVLVESSKYSKMKGSSELGPGETAAHTIVTVKNGDRAIPINMWCGKGVKATNFTFRIVGEHGEIVIGLGQHDIGVAPRLIVRSNGKKLVDKSYPQPAEFPDLGYNNIVRELFEKLEGKSKQSTMAERVRVKNMALAVETVHNASVKAVGKDYEKPMAQYKHGRTPWSGGNFGKAAVRWRRPNKR